MVQQDGQLSRHRYQRSLLRILVALPRQFQSPPLQIRVRTLLTQNAVRSLHQQLAQIYVAFLADSQLRPALARFTPPRTESYIAPYNEGWESRMPTAWPFYDQLCLHWLIEI